MTGPEFSVQFEVLYNDVTSNRAPGLSEDEKSVFLTKAQMEIVKNHLYNGNKYGVGFDGSGKRQVDFSMLMETSSKDSTADAVFVPHAKAKSVEMPSDVLTITNEYATVTRKNTTGIVLTVVPISFVEYDKLMSKPYKFPAKYQAWRITNTKTTTTGSRNNTTTSTTRRCDIIVGPNDTLTKYDVRYIRKPKPIVLYLDADEYGGRTIDGYPSNDWPKRDSDVVTECCELDSQLHDEILQRAVELAKAAWEGDLKSSVELGQRSE